METVHVTAPDLQRRATLERMRSRLLLATGGFALLFGAVIAKLADATILFPIHPKAAEIVTHLADVEAGETPVPPVAGEHAPRAMVVDRNGEILAMSLPTAGLYANPHEMMDVAEAAHRLKQALPRLNEDQVRTRLASAKQFVYLARQITPREELAVNALGIPGVYFQASERRRYPLGRVAAHLLGGVDVDGRGIAGVERFFDQRLRDNAEPLRLSIDVRVQAVLRDELQHSVDEFTAIGGCGIVMDVRTGEVIAMVSLPDYDANAAASAEPAQRFNRALTGMYEPGSTFKLQTAAMALDSGAAQLWNFYDAEHPIHIGRFTITDFEGKKRMLALPEVLAYSSNLGAAHIAQAEGPTRQRAWLSSMGMLQRAGIELPEAGMPIVPAVANWGEAANLTIGFGHGIAVSPLHVVRGTAALANGGILLNPTILARDPSAGPASGIRVMKPITSDVIRHLMRLVVTDGYGKPADIPGYFVGGKTGTAEKNSHGGYKKHTNVSAFMTVFPMNAPRYAVYFMLDEPHGNQSTGGYSTAGAVSAPAAGRVIAKIAPMLGLLPDMVDFAAITQQLSIPMQPPRGYSVRASTPSPGSPVEVADPAIPVTALPQGPPAIRPAGAPGMRPDIIAPSFGRRTPESLRHEARYSAPLAAR